MILSWKKLFNVLLHGNGKSWKNLKSNLTQHWISSIFFSVCLGKKKKETAKISALLSRGKKYSHRDLFLMNESYLREKFTVYKCLARGGVRGVFFSKYSKVSFEFALGYWWDSQGWFSYTLTVPEHPVNLLLEHYFLPFWLLMTLIFIFIWLLFIQHFSEPGNVLKANTQFLWKIFSRLLCWRLRVCTLCWSSNGSQYLNLPKVWGVLFPSLTWEMAYHWHVIF